MNICLCGAEAGYPHAEDCPRPLYRGTDRQCEQWEQDRARLVAAVRQWERERQEAGPRNYSGFGPFGE